MKYRKKREENNENEPSQQQICVSPPYCLYGILYERDQNKCSHTSSGVCNAERQSSVSKKPVRDDKHIGNEADMSDTGGHEDSVKNVKLPQGGDETRTQNPYGENDHPKRHNST
ncbi:MAG: hypothetical protein QF466_05680 [Desulfobacterales bacterium]|nr:hypothetical protein [Desulfobacterales bacterium]MDP6682426.1 hypothetical protein [Desulfobacterales bacterium]MDP6807176.1 hypothetical protein [Desulfobacterales bacterium]